MTAILLCLAILVIAYELAGVSSPRAMRSRAAWLLSMAATVETFWAELVRLARYLHTVQREQHTLYRERLDLDERKVA